MSLLPTLCADGVRAVEGGMFEILTRVLAIETVRHEIVGVVVIWLVVFFGDWVGLRCGPVVVRSCCTMLWWVARDISILVVSVHMLEIVAKKRIGRVISMWSWLLLIWE